MGARMPRLWKKIDLVEAPPVHLDETDDCYYARDYVAGGGYGASKANSLINNFKKPRSCQGDQLQWGYKLRDAKRFAAELSELLPKSVVVAAIPSSRTIDDPEYDPRMEMMLEELQRLRCDILIERPIIRVRPAAALHMGGRRSVEAVSETLAWAGFESTPDRVVLLDDVITTGASFKACARLVREHSPSTGISGAFWARAVWPER